MTSDAARRSGWGGAYMVGCAASFALMSMFVKLAAHRIPSHNLVFWRALVSLLLSYALVRQKGVSAWGHGKGLLMLRGALGCLGMLCIFKAVSTLPLAETTMIQYLHPTITALLAPLFLGERSHPKIWLALMLGFCGVAMVCASMGGPEESLFTGHLPAGVGFALGGSLLSSLAYITVRKLSFREDPLVIVFYFPLITLPVVFPIAASDWCWPQGIEWLWIAGLCVCTQLGQIWLTKGFASLPTSQASALTYVQVPFAALLGWLVFDSVPSAWTIIGALTIFAGASVAIRARQAAS